MRVGDLITTYHSGIFKLMMIVGRGKTSPLFKYIRMYDTNGNPKKGLLKECDSLWCRPASLHLDKMIEDAFRVKLIVENYVNI